MGILPPITDVQLYGSHPNNNRALHPLHPIRKAPKPLPLPPSTLLTPKRPTPKPYLWQHPTHTPPMLHTTRNLKTYSRLHHRLTNCGYHTAVITPIFHKATKNAIAYTSRTAIEQAARQQMLTSKTDKTVFFHLQFHPQDPTARDLQQAWQQTVATPPNDVPLSNLKNIDGINVPIQSLTIAYSRPTNLRNQFSIRNIENRGRAVSTYLN